MKRIAQGLAAGLMLFWVGGHGAHSAGFSAASLDGSCIWQILAVPTTSGGQAQAGPVTTLSWATFDGAGHVALDYDLNLNGTFSSSITVNGTYTVEANGHGSILYTNPVSGNVVDSDFFITPLGQAILTQTRAFNANAVTPRVSNGTCVFSE